MSFPGYTYYHHTFHISGGYSLFWYVTVFEVIFRLSNSNIRALKVRFLLIPVSECTWGISLDFSGSGQWNCCCLHLIDLLLFLFVQNYNCFINFKTIMCKRSDDVTLVDVCLRVCSSDWRTLNNSLFEGFCYISMSVECPLPSCSISNLYFRIFFTCKTLIRVCCEYLQSHMQVCTVQVDDVINFVLI